MADFWWISILWNDIRWPLVSLYISRKTINLFRTWGYLRCPYGCSCNCYIRWSLDSVFIWENYYYIDLGQTVTSGLLLDISLKVNPGHLTVGDFLWISIFQKKKNPKKQTIRWPLVSCLINKYITLGPKVFCGLLMDVQLKMTPGLPTVTGFWWIFILQNDKRWPYRLSQLLLH